MRKEFKNDMKTSEKKNQTEMLEIKSSLKEIKNTVKSHSSRLEQVEDTILGLKDKIKFIKKPEEPLDKRLKTCERNI
jgi:chromosome segregation ATPase